MLTATDIEGKFKIRAKIKDTIKFSSVGYKTYFLKLEPKHFGITSNIIKVSKDMIKLKSVVVRKHDLKGILAKDINKVKEEKKLNLFLPYKGKERTQTERRIYTTGFLLGYLINSINGNLKRWKKQLQLEKEYIEIKYLRDNYKDYIVKDLQINKANLYRYLEYLVLDSNYKTFKAMDKMQQIDYIRESVKAFKSISK